MIGLLTNKIDAEVPFHKCLIPKVFIKVNISLDKELLFVSPVTIAMFTTQSGFVTRTLMTPAKQDEIKDKDRLLLEIIVCFSLFFV